MEKVKVFLVKAENRNSILKVYVKLRKNKKKRDFKRKNTNKGKRKLKILNNFVFLSKIMYTKFEKRQNI